MSELELRLARLGEEIDWPETPDLAVGVAARLRSQAETRRRRPRPALPRLGLRGSLALALVALLLLAGTVMAAVPAARDAVLDFLGLQGATVERTDTLPEPPPPRALDFGRRTTLAEARAALGVEPLVPADPGTPDRVGVRRSVPGGELMLGYRARPGLPRTSTTSLGLLVSEFRGDLNPDYVQKIAGQATAVERLRVGGRRAIWLEGAPHFFFYRGPHGRFVETQLRLAQNVLLLERGRLLIRLEGAFGRERAVAIAESLR